MSDVPSVRTSEVRDALKFFIDIGMAVSVDAEGWVYSVIDAKNKRITIGPEDKVHPVVIYQEVIPKDAVYVINPFAEGLGDRTPPTVFWYKIQRAALNARLIYAIDSLLSLAFDQHELLTAKPSAKSAKANDNKPSFRASPRLTSILAQKVDGQTVVEAIDATMLDEIRTFMSAHQDRLIEPVYKAAIQRTEIHLEVLDDPGFVATIHTMRKKTIATFQAILRGIFQLGPDEMMEKFATKRMEGAPSKLSSWLAATFKLYQVLNEVIDELPDPTAPDHLVNLDTYQYHLDRLPAYFANAKFMMSPTAQAETPQMRQPIATPMPGVAPPPPGVATPSGVPAGYRRVPGPIMADGSMGPPSLVPDLGVQETPAMVAGAMPMAGMVQPGMAMMPQPIYGQPQQIYGQPQQQGWYGAQPMMPQAGYYQPTLPANLPVRQGTGMPAYQPGPVAAWSGIPGMPIIR